MNNIIASISLAISLLITPFFALAELDYKSLSDAYKRSYQYEKTENYTDAVKAIMLVYNYYPDAYTVNLRLGHLYLQQSLFANANRHYQKAQKALPYSISPQLGSMSVAITQVKYKEAETIGFNILKTDQYNYYANLKLAYIFTQSKKYENAQTIIEKMLTLYPEDVLYLSQYAALFAAQKQFDKATDYYSNVLILDPENIDANYYFSLEK